MSFALMTLGSTMPDPIFESLLLPLELLFIFCCFCEFVISAAPPEVVVIVFPSMIDIVLLL